MQKYFNGSILEEEYEKLMLVRETSRGMFYFYVLIVNWMIAVQLDIGRSFHLQQTNELWVSALCWGVRLLWGFFTMRCSSELAHANQHLSVGLRYYWTVTTSCMVHISLSANKGKNFVSFYFWIYSQNSEIRSNEIHSINIEYYIFNPWEKF